MPNHPKHAQPEHPVHDLVARRWSPYGFASRPVGSADLRSLFAAASWAPSSYNEQPWRYIVATQDDAPLFQRVLGCLVPANQAWAQAAPVLALGVVSLRFARNGADNGAAVHDLGLAAGGLCFEATARGLCVHQMIGLDAAKAQSEFAVPEGFRVLTALAIGYAADVAGMPAELAKRDAAPRTRRPLAQTVFGGTWGAPAAILGAPAPAPGRSGLGAPAP